MRGEHFRTERPGVQPPRKPRDASRDPPPAGEGTAGGLQGHCDGTDVARPRGHGGTKTNRRPCPLEQIYSARRGARGNSTMRLGSPSQKTLMGVMHSVAWKGGKTHVVTIIFAFKMFLLREFTSGKIHSSYLSTTLLHSNIF